MIIQWPTTRVGYRIASSKNEEEEGVITQVDVVKLSKPAKHSHEQVRQILNENYRF